MIDGVARYWSSFRTLMSFSSDDREKLLGLLREHSVLRGDFVLASGKRSNIYIDARLTTLRAEAMPLIGRAILHLCQERGWQPQC